MDNHPPIPKDVKLVKTKRDLNLQFEKAFFLTKRLYRELFKPKGENR
jgi:hypothetical protein